MHTEIIYRTSTVADGNMSFRFGDAGEVVDNRRRFLKENGGDYASTVCMQCNHGDIVSPIDWSTPKKHFGAVSHEDMITSEVLVTKEKGIVLMVLTADCIPGIFYDPVRGVLALAHLNRKTIAHHLTQKTVGFLREECGTNPADLLVHFAPHIKKDSYHYPLPLTDPVPDALVHHIEEKDGRAYIDMTEAEIEELERAGVRRDHVSVSDSDVGTSSAYFSHYRSKHDKNIPQGRMATFAMLS